MGSDRALVESFLSQYNIMVKLKKTESKQVMDEVHVYIQSTELIESNLRSFN